MSRRRPYVSSISAKRDPAIPILQKHLNFVLEQHTRYASEENLRPQSLGTLFTTAWTRQALDAIVEKGLIHLTEVQPYLFTPRLNFLPIAGTEALGISERLGVGSIGSIPFRKASQYRHFTSPNPHSTQIGIGGACPKILPSTTQTDPLQYVFVCLFYSGLNILLQTWKTLSRRILRLQQDIYLRRTMKSF